MVTVDLANRSSYVQFICIIFPFQKQCIMNFLVIRQWTSSYLLVNFLTWNFSFRTEHCFSCYFQIVFPNDVNDIPLKRYRNCASFSYWPFFEIFYGLRAVSNILTAIFRILSELRYYIYWTSKFSESELLCFLLMNNLDFLFFLKLTFEMKDLNSNTWTFAIKKVNLLFYKNMNLFFFFTRERK